MFLFSWRLHRHFKISCPYHWFARKKLTVLFHFINGKAVQQNWIAPSLWSSSWSETHTEQKLMTQRTHTEGTEESNREAWGPEPTQTHVSLLSPKYAGRPVDEPPPGTSLWQTPAQKAPLCREPTCCPPLSQACSATRPPPGQLPRGNAGGAREPAESPRASSQPC